MRQPLMTGSVDWGLEPCRLVDIPSTCGGAGNRELVELQIRTLDDHDLPEIERHMLALDSISRRSRFGSAFGDTSVLAYVRRIDLTRALLVGAADPTGRIVGLAEAQPTTLPEQVEMAVSIHAAYRLRGLGGHLVNWAMKSAFARGAVVAQFLFARDNQAIVGLIRAIGGQFTGLDRAQMVSAGSLS
jgi:ribosomal protein S18 acetylase RimI-like enzyme